MKRSRAAVSIHGLLISAAVGGAIIGRRLPQPAPAPPAAAGAAQPVERAPDTLWAVLCEVRVRRVLAVGLGHGKVYWGTELGAALVNPTERPASVSEVDFAAHFHSATLRDERGRSWRLTVPEDPPSFSVEALEAAIVVPPHGSTVFTVRNLPGTELVMAETGEPLSGENTPETLYWSLDAVVQSSVQGLSGEGPVGRTGPEWRVRGRGEAGVHRTSP